MKFLGVYFIKANLECITGLHIGGSKDSFEIGGIDNPVIKTTTSIKLPDGREIKADTPYIPGSSLKGKIRSLLEWQYSIIKLEGNSSKIEYEENSPIPIVFGKGANERNKEEYYGPTRVKFYDSYPTKETIKKWEEEIGFGLYTELKVENAIDRITSKANPRLQERVPVGSEFEVNVVYEMFDKQDKDRLKIVFEGMRRLEDNYLGGGGTRGNGRVRFKNITIEFRNKEYYLGNADSFKSKNYNDVGDVLKNFEEVKNLFK